MKLETSISNDPQARLGIPQMKAHVNLCRLQDPPHTLDEADASRI
jgi:hypothetical protein